MPRAALISAALRHVRDAEHLLAPGPHRSIEQALHLAGFGPECVRKACVDENMADKAFGHEFARADESVVDLLLALDPSASRYGLDEHTLKLPHREKHWSVDCRYMPTGELDARTGQPKLKEEDVADVVREAREFVDDCVVELWCDGVLSEDGLR
jgi:hypothetical protein